MNGEAKTMGSKIRIILPTSYALFVASFELLLPIALIGDIGKFFFPMVNPIDTILAVYATLSLSLLARFFGGIVFGHLGDVKGRSFVILLTASGLLLSTLVTVFVPTVYEIQGIGLEPIYATIFFIITRIAAGFFIGGIWPTGGILAMEKLNKIDSGKSEPKNTRKFTISSSLVQIGFQSGVLAAILILLFIPVDIFCNNNGDTTSIMCVKWKFMFFLGSMLSLSYVIFHILSSSSKNNSKSKNNDENISAAKYKLWHNYESEEFKQSTSNDDEQKRGIYYIVDKFKNNSTFRSVFVGWWLIWVALMYMYYTTMAMLPTLFKHIGWFNDKIRPYDLGLSVVLNTGSLKWDSITENIPIIPVIPIVLGIILMLLFNKFKKNSSGKWKKITLITVLGLLIIPSGWILGSIDRYGNILSPIGIAIISLVSHLWLGVVGWYVWKHKKGFEWIKNFISGFRILNSNYSNGNDKKLIENSDGMMFVFIGIMLSFWFVLSVISLAITYSSDPDNLKSNTSFQITLIVSTIVLFLFANAGWSFSSSSLSSLFPTHARNSGASLIYNGGLMIGFASPLISSLLIFHYNIPQAIMISILLGAIGLIIGGRKIIQNTDKRPITENKKTDVT